MMVAGPPTEPDPEALARRVGAIRALSSIREASGEAEVYLVGGFVRDILMGRERDDVDLVVVPRPGDPDPLEPGSDWALRALGPDVVRHQRFGTLSATVEGTRVDVVRARRETYPSAGSLPEVTPGTLDDDLARRDFTVNAMALALDSPGELIDPHDGAADLRDGLLRVLHAGSFRDDPTRVIRGARYVARLGLAFESGTERAAHEADLGTVSADRRDAELARLACEPDPGRGFALLADLGAIELPAAGPDEADQVARLLEREPWQDVAPRRDAVLAAAHGRGGEVADSLARSSPERPSRAVALAAGVSETALPLARVRGAEWLDRWAEQWRHERSSLTGEDLMRAGVPEGPAIGRGLRAALEARLDGDAPDRESELEVAVAAAEGAAGKSEG